MAENMLIQEDPGIKRRRALAEAMMAQGMQSGPVGHWVEGLGRVAQAWAGNKMAEKADTEQKARQQGAYDALSKALQPTEVTDPVTGQVTKQEPTYDSLAAAMSQNPDLAPLAMQFQMSNLQNKAKTQAELEAAMRKPTQVGDQLVVPRGSGGTPEVLFEGRQKAPEGMRYGATGELEPIPGYVDMRSQIAAAGRAPDNTLVEIADPNSPSGTIWVPRTEAAGKPGKGNNPPKKPMPASALKMQQEEIDALSTAANVQADLAQHLKKIESGELELGLLRNVQSAGRNMVGRSDEVSRNYESFVANLEKLRNDTLRLNKGVQTEGDAIRAWNELLKNIRDKDLVSQRLQEIMAINERAVNIRDMNVQSIRENFGQEPMDLAKYKSPKPAVSSIGPAVGDVVDGYEFLGGDPAAPASWRKK